MNVALTNRQEKKHYACRVCIANKGLKGVAIPTLPTSPEPVRKHIEEEHIRSSSDSS